MVGEMGQGDAIEEIVGEGEKGERGRRRGVVVVLAVLERWHCEGCPHLPQALISVVVALVAQQRPPRHHHQRHIAQGRPVVLSSSVGAAS